MSVNGNLVKVTKDDQEALVDKVQVEGLEAHGWTVVDDGHSEPGQVTAPVENAVVAEGHSADNEE